MRQSLKGRDYGMNPEFKNRGEEQTRIETFSDAVFALAVTLLVLSSTVPETFQDLRDSFADIIPFGICISLLMIIWYQHYIFFIRYGFKDVKIVAINAVLLFLVLVYVYPLKFLFQVLYKLFMAGITSDDEKIKYLFSEVIKREDAQELMIIYGLGGAAVFILLAIMYWVAHNRKKPLGLSKIELYHTKTSIYDNLVMGGIPLLSAIIASFGFKNGFMWSGIVYYSYAFAMPIFHIFRDKRKKKLFPKGK